MFTEFKDFIKNHLQILGYFCLQLRFYIFLTITIYLIKRNIVKPYIIEYGRYYVKFIRWLDQFWF